MRIGGLASGIDTEQMIMDLMRVERMKVDKYFRQEEALKWQRDALTTTNKTLADFIIKSRNDFGMTRTTNTGTILRSSMQSFDWVKKVGSSDENVIKATASATAMEGTYRIKVEQLADVASVMSGDLKDVLDDNNRFKEENSFTISTKYGKSSIEIGEGDFINDIVKQINNAVDVGDGETSLGLRAAYDANLGKLMINTKEQGEEQFISIRSTSGDLGGGESDFVSILTGEVNDTAYRYHEISFDEENTEIKINGEDITDDVKNVDDLIKYINDNFNNEYIAYKSGNGMTIRNVGGADEMQITVNNDLNVGEAIHGVGGKDAQIEFNGDIIEQSSNNFTMFGVNYQLQSAKPGETVTVNVESDVDGMFNKIKEFVDNYNEMIDELNGFLKEKNYRDFQPLTKEEKEAMTEKEIELWEEKAKSGLLRNDETVSRILQSMRDGLYGSVHDGWKYGEDRKENTLDGFYHITQIGITTSNYQSGGKLEINEEKLRSAIIDNPDGVINLLFKTSDVSVSSKNAEQARQEADEKRANSGIIERLFDDMITGMKDIVRRAGAGEDAATLRNVQSNMLIDFVTSGSISVMDRDIMNIGKRIATEEMNLMRREERYWNQFTAMEKALEKMNQQSTWLMTQLGQMGN
ncbi:MAG TPA: flagellar filament capping protein FliD [Oscillospiraceae bacterium]|nr:flagellar filament capping protein FliD [Oscillospiraceae bacterium]